MSAEAQRQSADTHDQGTAGDSHSEQDLAAEPASTPDERQDRDDEQTTKRAEKERKTREAHRRTERNARRRGETAPIRTAARRAQADARKHVADEKERERARDDEYRREAKENAERQERATPARDRKFDRAMRRSRRIGERVADELERLVGQEATWANFAVPSTLRALQMWMSRAYRGKSIRLERTTKINCWEMVLLAANRVGAMSWGKLHEMYRTERVEIPRGKGRKPAVVEVAVGSEEWFKRLPSKMAPAGRTPYTLGSTKGPSPRRGDLVFFNGCAHVAMATGKRDARGRLLVYTFWPPPDTAYDKQGNAWDTVDKVKIKTIDELAAYMNSRHMSNERNPAEGYKRKARGNKIVVEFGMGPW